MPNRPFRDRFEDLREVHVSSTTSVFFGWDALTGERVAIKVLNGSPGPDEIAAFVQEFRRPRDQGHPNIVRHIELHAGAPEPWFSMEWVEGAHLRNWAGPRDVPDQSVLLAVAQAANGLAWLHHHGIVHRDIKPENILIDTHGRPRIIDFGISARRATVANGMDDVGVDGGTVIYMSPEQRRGDPVGPESDVYSLGATLDELWNDPHAQCNWAPRNCRDGGEGDPRVDALIARMRTHDPAERPSAELVRDELLLLAGPGASLMAPLPPPRPLFLGREAELQSLEAACAAAFEARSAHLVEIVGTPGMGKTALAYQLIKRLEERYQPAGRSQAHGSPGSMLVLVGRCSSMEVVAFNALDEVIGQVRKSLAPRSDVFTPPRHARALRKVFPVLGQVPAIAEAAAAEPELDADNETIQKLAFTALSELLTALSDGRPVVVWIDDLHWSDPDSRTALRAIFGGPTPPPVLLLATRRDDAADPLALPILTTRCPLAPLDDATSHAIVRELCHRTGDKAERLVGAANGHPLFLAIAARALNEHADAAPDTLDEVLRVQFAGLAPEVVDVVRAVCVASRPITDPELLSVTGHPAQLAADHAVTTALLRVASSLGERQYEPFHAKVRDAVLGSMTGAQQAALHARLAETWERLRPDDADVIALHWEASATPTRALPWLIQAATEADGVLAFDRAVACHERLVRLLPPDAPERADCFERYADALVAAGRPTEAAAAYTTAAEGASADVRRRRLLAATEQLLASGHAEEGVRSLQARFEEDGITVPRHRLALLAEVGWMQALTKVGVTRFASGRRIAGGAVSRKAADTAFVGATGLIFGDMIFGAWLQSVHFVHGQHAQDDRLAIRALTTQAGFLAINGPSAIPKAWALLAAADHRADQQEPARGDDRDREALHAYRAVMRAAVAWSATTWTQTRDFGREALDRMNGRVYGRTFVWNFAWSVVLDAMYWRGDIAELRALLPGLLRDVDRRGNRYASAMIRGRFVAALQMLDGDPEGSLTLAAEAAAAAGDDHTLTLLHLIALHHRGEVAMLSGDGDAVLDEFSRRSWALFWSGLGFSYPHRTKLRELEGRALVAAAARATGLRKAWLLLRAMRCARRIEGEGTPFAALLAGIIRCCARRVSRGEPDAAELARLAAEARRLDMAMHAAALEHARAVDAGAPLAPSADAWFRANLHGDRDAMARALVPGHFDGRRAAAGPVDPPAHHHAAPA